MRFMSSSTKFQYRTFLSRFGTPGAEILRPPREYAVRNLLLPQGFWRPTPVSRANRKLAQDLLFSRCCCAHAPHS